MEGPVETKRDIPETKAEVVQAKIDVTHATVGQAALGTAIPKMMVDRMQAMEGGLREI